MNEVQQLIDIIKNGLGDVSYEGNIKQIAYIHKKVHDGNYHKITRYVEDLANDGEINILIKTGNKEFHYITECKNIGSFTLDIYRVSTITNIGTSLPIYNANDANSQIPVIKAYHTPTISGLTQIDHDDSVSPNTAPAKSSSQLRSGEENIFNKNKYYLLRLKNISGAQSAVSSIKIEGYEENE